MIAAGATAGGIFAGYCGNTNPDTDAGPAGFIFGVSAFGQGSF